MSRWTRNGVGAFVAGMVCGSAVSLGAYVALTRRPPAPTAAAPVNDPDPNPDPVALSRPPDPVSRSPNPVTRSPDPVTRSPDPVTRSSGPTRPQASRSAPSSSTADLPAGLVITGTNAVMTPAYRDYIIQNAPSIAQSAAAIPYMVNGTLQGFTLTRIRPNSLFAKLGARDGDVVDAIDGVPLRDLPTTLALLNGLKTKSNVSLRILRNGTPILFTIAVR